MFYRIPPWLPPKASTTAAPEQIRNPFSTSNDGKSLLFPGLPVAHKAHDSLAIPATTKISRLPQVTKDLAGRTSESDSQILHDFLDTVIAPPQMANVNQLANTLHVHLARHAC
ncbi:hypothetical protein IQ07DRAFT_643397 [Pyrenochaeta sp. DS3sAY3a]|nr:hypothetical protein IQ07DRAFT_643397 [Pyrenochaeta sp. DS3sAY3a]